MIWHLYFRQFNGKGIAECEVVAEGLTCHIEFDSLQIIPSEPDTYLRKKYADSPNVVREKSKLGRIFKEDPKGILTITCQTKGCGL